MNEKTKKRLYNLGRSMRLMELTSQLPKNANNGMYTMFTNWKTRNTIAVAIRKETENLIRKLPEAKDDLELSLRMFEMFYQEPFWMYMGPN